MAFRRNMVDKLWTLALISRSQTDLACADLESFVRGGPTLTFFGDLFLVDEGREDPSSARQRNAIKWRVDYGQHSWLLCDFQGIRTSIPKKPYVLVIFQCVGGPDPYQSVSL